MVKVKVSGALEVKELVIDAEAIDPDDPELLQDTIIAAVNEGLRSAQSLMEQRMGGMMGGLGGLGLPGL
jgi:DNA-binding YbaB/EbfC family protein